MLAGWREHVAGGEATISGSALVIVSDGPPMTEVEWQSAYCEPETLH